MAVGKNRAQRAERDSFPGNTPQPPWRQKKKGLSRLCDVSSTAEALPVAARRRWPAKVDLKLWGADDAISETRRGGRVSLGYGQTVREGRQGGLTQCRWAMVAQRSCVLRRAWARCMEERRSGGAEEQRSRGAKRRKTCAAPRARMLRKRSFSAPTSDLPGKSRNSGPASQ